MPLEARVKSVLSGDTVVLSHITNPSQERVLSLAYVSAPRLRREGDEVSDYLCIFGFVVVEQMNRWPLHKLSTNKYSHLPSTPVNSFVNSSSAKSFSSMSCTLFPPAQSVNTELSNSPASMLPCPTLASRKDGPASATRPASAATIPKRPWLS